MVFFQMTAVLVIITIAAATCAGYTHRDGPVGYSYAKFSGPVSGPEQEIQVKDDHKGHGVKVDYVAKPDYHFAYGVEDPKSKVSQSRKETRHGDAVHGEYSVVDPDGTLRTVKYTADKHNGFQAEVFTNGKIQVHQAPAPASGQGHHESYNKHSDDDEDDDDY